MRTSDNINYVAKLNMIVMASMFGPNMRSAGKTKTKSFGKSKLSCYQNVSYMYILIKKMNTNTW